MIVVLLLLVTLAQAALRSKVVDLGIVGEYLFSPMILTGALNSVCEVARRSTCARHPNVV